MDVLQLIVHASHVSAYLICKLQIKTRLYAHNVNRLTQERRVFRIDVHPWLFKLPVPWLRTIYQRGGLSRSVFNAMVPDPKNWETVWVFKVYPPQVI